MAWLHRHYKSTNLQLSVACEDLGKAEAAGWTEDRPRVQWAAQRMAQSKEGQADEAERREKRYEELGQMLVQIDEFILALSVIKTSFTCQTQLTFCRTRLEEALKKDDTETAIREAETAKYLAEKREALKQKIAAKARELVGPNGISNHIQRNEQGKESLLSYRERERAEEFLPSPPSSRCLAAGGDYSPNVDCANLEVSGQEQSKREFGYVWQQPDEPISS